MANVELSTEGVARSDGDLILAARAGDDLAYAELYERHVGAARAAARNLVRDRSSADDLVSEAFTRVLAAIRRGGGPEIAFRPYLLTSVRNAFFSRARTPDERNVTAGLDDTPVDELRMALADPLIGSEDRAIIARAFAALPERWQMVLWHTEVEGRAAAEVAPLLNIAPNAVAALAYRAREGLREAYLQAHLQTESPVTCREARSKLGAYVRDGLGTRDREHVDEHLNSCETCRELLAELRDVSVGLRTVVAPAILGVPLAAYIGKLGVAHGLARLWPRTKTQRVVTGSAVVAAVVAGALIANAAVGGNNGPKLGALAPPRATAAAPTTAAPTTASRFVNPTSPARPTTSGSSTTLATTTAAPASVAAPLVASSSTTARPVVSTPTAATTQATTAPPTTTTTTALVPSSTTTTTTTVPPPTTTTTTTTTAPRPVADISVSGSLLGPAVAGRSIYLSAVVANAGPGTADAVALAISLPDRLVFDRVAAIGGGGQVHVDVASPGWTCTATDTAHAVCMLPHAVDNGASSTLLVRADVLVPAQVLSASSPRRFAASAAVAPNNTITIVATTSANDPVATSNTSEVVVGDIHPDGLSARYATIDHGNITLTGAPLMGCDTTEATCSAATGEAPTAPNPSNNGAFTMSAIGADGNGITALSSATLTVPPGATIARAFVVWGAKGDALVPDEFRDATIAVGNDPVKTLHACTAAERAGAPATCDGDVTVTTTGTNGDIDGVFASVDVTHFAKDTSATYTFASKGGYTAAGTNRAGGWSLVVVYHLASEPLRSLVVLDGMVGYGGGSNSELTMPLGGLGPASKAASIDLRFGIVAFDGDRGLHDNMTLKAAAAESPINDVNNPTDDVLNSTISVAGELLTPSNTLGFDADVIDVQLATTGGDLSLVGHAAEDQVRIGMIILSAPAG